ncbi:MAG: gliding motility-associated-like protein [Saprospiraceae bacterium]
MSVFLQTFILDLKKAIIILLLLYGNAGHAQPFECEGDFFLALANTGNSIFYRVEIDQNTNAVLFNALPAANSGVRINAIGYRITDNYIYGVEIGTSNLCQVDATGTATVIAVLNGLNANYGYYAGEISPDGQYLYLLSSGGNPYISRDLVRVDLNDYSLLTIPIPNAATAEVLCTDFSFDPIDGSLYGFDLVDNRLIKIDPLTGIIDESLYPITTVADAMGGIFFDAFGNLYGYGDQLNSGVANTFFKIDKTTGIITIEAIGPAAVGKDGCACPYTIELRKIVYPKSAFPCTEVTYVFEIANASAIDHTGIDFLDELPTELTITEIVQNPFGGTIVSGVGGSVLLIENVIIPKGIDSIVVRAEVAPGAEGIYKNQAILMNLPVALGSETLSDDPSTLAIDDSTSLEIVPLFVDLQNDTAGICNGDTLILNAATYGVVYLWNDGSTDSLKWVTEEGLYWVEVKSGCETVYDSILVSENAVNINLGPDREIELGDSVLLFSTITGNPVLQWFDPLENSLSCLTCPEPFARPFFDVEYILSGTDEFGCYDEDAIQIRVNKDRAIYVPNVFSPNFDGLNDVFYIQGKGYGIVKTFRIFNRWGALIFESRNGFVNDTGHSWDGTFNGKDLNPAVFVYYVEVEYLDGVVEVLAGDVTLVK